MINKIIALNKEVDKIIIQKFELANENLIGNGNTKSEIGANPISRNAYMSEYYVEGYWFEFGKGLDVVSGATNAIEIEKSSIETALEYATPTEKQNIIDILDNINN